MFRLAGFKLSVADLFEFGLPGWVILILGAVVLAALAIYYARNWRSMSAAVRYSDLNIVRSVARSGKSKYRVALPVLRLAALGFLIVAFARPQSGTETREVTAEGIDIILALDISGSMKAEDFKPLNRLSVAKEEIKEFVSRRVNDRIGLVVFAKSAFTQCPLTIDYGVLLTFLDQVQFGLIDDGTAIGTALATAVTRLKDSESKSRIIILLTDGVNNSGEIDPVTAARIAQAYDIKVYTIGVGKPGNAMYPIDDPIFGKRYAYLPNEIDVEALQEIAEMTGGKFYRARSEDELYQIYVEIDALEKTEIKVNDYVKYRELFPGFIMIGFLLLGLEVVLAQTVLRKIP